jgi:hypothetical protein
VPPPPTFLTFARRLISNLFSFFYNRIDKLAAIDGMQDIISNLKHISETDMQVAAFKSHSDGSVGEGSGTNAEQGAPGEDRATSKQYQLRRSRTNSVVIENVLEQTAKELRVTIHRMDSMREDMIAGINAKSTVVEMLKKQLEDEQVRSKKIRMKQDSERGIIQKKLEELQSHTKKLQREKKLLVADVKLSNQKLEALEAEREHSKRLYESKINDYNALEAALKKENDDSSNQSVKEGSDATKTLAKGTIERLHSLPEFKFPSTLDAPEEVKQLEEAIEYIKSWKSAGVRITENNDGTVHAPMVKKLEDLITDNLNLRNALYQERLSCLLP